MKRILKLNKDIGETPLQVIQKYKRENPKYKDIKMAYAGRLDPLAEGKLLILVGDECKQREKYHQLDKEYEFEVLIGFKTDSGDPLGLVLETKRTKKISEAEIKNIEKDILKITKMKYPIFSSKYVKGKTLFAWYFLGKINEIKIPSRNIIIHDFKFINERFVDKGNLIKELYNRIFSFPKIDNPKLAWGKDFRRKEIWDKWKEVLNKYDNNTQFQILKFKATVSSGTYMRVLAELVAEKLNSVGLAISIKRTKIGKVFTILNYVFWWKRF